MFYLIFIFFIQKSVFWVITKLPVKWNLASQMNVKYLYKVPLVFFNFFYGCKIPARFELKLLIHKALCLYDFY